MSADCPRSTRRVRRTPRLLLFLLLVLPLFPGCKGWEYPWSGSEPEDPFFPGGPIPKQTGTPPPQPQPQPPAGPGQSDIPVPPPPSTPTPTPGQPTAMTTGSTASDSTKDPRYTNTNNTATRTDPNDSWTPRPASGPANNVPLHPAETAASGSTAPATSGVTQVGGVQTVQTVDEAYAKLDSYGMTWSDLKRQDTNPTTSNSTYLFSCYFLLHDNQQPGAVFSVENAQGVTRLAALREAIRQYEEKYGVK